MKHASQASPRRSPSMASRSGTFTTEGFIPHMVVPLAGGAIVAPVKLVTEPNGRGAKVVYGGRNDLQLPVPLRRGNRLVYALPGGDEVIG